MLSIFGVSIVLYFIKILSGSRNLSYLYCQQMWKRCDTFSYDFGVTRNSSSNADAMVLASARLRGIQPPDNIQNGGRPGANASQTRTG